MRPSERASVAAQTNLRRISGVSPSSSIRMHIVTWCEQHCNGLTRVGPAVGRTPRSPLPLLQADLHADKTNQVEGRFGHASDACVTRIGPGPFPTWLRCGLAQSGCGRGRAAGTPARAGRLRRALSRLPATVTVGRQLKRRGRGHFSGHGAGSRRRHGLSAAFQSRSLHDAGGHCKAGVIIAAVAGRSYESSHR